MKLYNDWYDRPIHRRAPAGGEIGIDGRERKGGEFEPFYVPRNLMPQVDESDLPALIDFVTERGARVTTVTLSATEIHFHQHVDMALINHMTPEVFAKPILISRDRYVLDGNHRAAAHMKFGVPVTCLTIEADFEEAMQLIFAFPKTYTYDENHTAERN